MNFSEMTAFGIGIPQIEDDTGTEFYSWAYDDMTEAGVAIDSKLNEEIYSKVFENSFRRKAFQQDVKMKSKKKNLSFDRNKLKIKCGLKQVNFQTFQIHPFPSTLNKIAKDAKFHLMRMLESCGQDLRSRSEVFQLFSALLSSYFFRFLTEENLFSNTEKVSLHAPILTCNLKDGAEGFLKEVVSSVAVDTSDRHASEDYGELYYKQPSCLPTALTNRRIIDCAYIKIRQSSKKCFETPYPAQYRDTGVFIGARFFPARDLIQFQQRNLWAALVFYGIRDQNLLIDPIRLDGGILSKYSYEETWDAESIRQLIIYFIIWLQKRFKEEQAQEYFLKRLDFFNRLIANHNRKHGAKKIRGLQRIWMNAQLLSVEEFCNFGIKVNCWSDEEGKGLLAEWNHLLLPECNSNPQVFSTDPVHRNFILPERDCLELFQGILKQALTRENWIHIIYVPAKGTFPLRKGDTEVWGYVREYQDRKAHQRILTLQIRETEFSKIARQLASVTCDWYEIVNCLRKKKPTYLLPSKTTRMPGIGTEEKTLILKADQLDFLLPEANELILSASLLNGFSAID